MKSLNKEQQAEATTRARALGNRYDCDLYGRFPWDRSERRGKATGLSKAGLGAFVYAVLMAGGDITSFYVFSMTQGGAVFARVRLTLEAREQLEKDGPYCFDPPPCAHLN